VQPQISDKDEAKFSIEIDKLLSDDDEDFLSNASYEKSLKQRDLNQQLEGKQEPLSAKPLSKLLDLTPEQDEDTLLPELILKKKTTSSQAEKGKQRRLQIFEEITECEEKVM
jgi:hypothetical protein